VIREVVREMFAGISSLPFPLRRFDTAGNWWIAGERASEQIARVSGAIYFSFR